LAIDTCRFGTDFCLLPVRLSVFLEAHQEVSDKAILLILDGTDEPVLDRNDTRGGGPATS